MSRASKCTFGADGTYSCSARAQHFPSDAPFQVPAAPGQFSCAGTNRRPPAEAAMTRARSAGAVGPGGEPFQRPAAGGVPGPFAGQEPMPIGQFAERISGA